MGQYRSSLTGTLQSMDTTGSYYGELIGSVEPTVEFLYNNLMTNEIFYGIVIAVLVISVFSFSD